MGLRLSIKTNQAQVLSDLDAFAVGVLNVAKPRALNKLAAQAETAGMRKVAEVYGIGPRTFEKYVQVKPASESDLEADLIVAGKGFPLELFEPRQTKQGVTASVKGHRFLIQHAFIARMASGHVGVFARGAYGGKGKILATGEAFGRFQFGAKRLSINELFTFAAHDAWAAQEVIDAMDARVEEQQGAIIAHEIEFARRSA